MFYILAYIRVPSVALTAQMWAGRISCSKALSGAYKSLCIHKTLSFIHSFIHFFFFETGIWSCIFLVIGITWSYLFLVWSYKIYLTWLFLYEENKRLFFIKQFFFYISVDFHVIDNFKFSFHEWLWEPKKAFDTKQLNARMFLNEPTSYK